MSKKNNRRNKPKSFDLRGDSNLETALNTVNVFVGLTSTTIFTGASLVTNGAELFLDKAVPKKVAKAIVDTACDEGLMATWYSLTSEDSTRASTDVIYSWKNKFIGDSKKKTKGNTTHLDEELAKLDPTTLVNAERALKTYVLSLNITREDISKMIKKHGLAKAMEKLDRRFNEA